LKIVGVPTVLGKRPTILLMEAETSLAAVLTSVPCTKARETRDEPVEELPLICWTPAMPERAFSTGKVT